LNKDTTKDNTKVPKKSKKVTEAPKHTHPLTEEADDTCKLCETQGNVMEPELTKAEFEAVAESGLSIQERLKAILANSEEDPEDPEEEPSTSEAEAETEADETLKVKLAKLIAEEDGEDPEDVEVEQLVETPPSQAKLSELMGKLSTEDGKTYNFDALCEEMEEA
jgi:arsenate reductase-like glutaredoxin family protein